MLKPTYIIRALKLEQAIGSGRDEDALPPCSWEASAFVKRLLVTGSRHGFPGLWEALDAACEAFGWPDEMHVREQRGVDQEAQAWARDRGGIVIRQEWADPKEPSPQRYHDANQRMVDKCSAGDIAIGFPAHDSRGTWDCLRRAHKAGLRCYAADPETRRIKRWPK